MGRIIQKYLDFASFCETRPVVLLRYMKRVIAVLLTVGSLWVMVLISDFLTTPPTSAAESAAATKYLLATGLPTPPRPFAHDGCTLFPDSLLGHDFYPACINHDIGYWAGGSMEQRDTIDMQFYLELKETGFLGPVFFAPLMYTAVHYLGNNWLSHQIGSNWGFGWNE
jgi:hypothetical protein